MALIGSTNRRHSGRGHDQRLALGEKVLSLRNQGQTLRSVCQELGISRATAQRYMDLALDWRIPPTVDLYRRQANDRLDATQREIEEQLEIANALGRQAYADPSSVNVKLITEAASLRNQAIALQLRLDERRAKLNGLDAPVRADITVTQVDETDAEMAEMIREAKARQAAQEEMHDGA